MAALWIRYETTYDSFHKKADRLYCVNLPNLFAPSEVSRDAPYPLSEYLKTTFPEVADATTVIGPWKMTMSVEDVKYPAKTLMIDSSFLNIFDIKIIEGSMEFLIPESKKMAITREKSLQMFGNESPIGKSVNNGIKTVTTDSQGNITGKEDGNYTICAVVNGFS